jgi:hypothetical protein
MFSGSQHIHVGWWTFLFGCLPVGYFNHSFFAEIFVPSQWSHPVLLGLSIHI